VVADVQHSEVTEVLNRPISRELLARDLTRLAYVAKDGTPRTIPIRVEWEAEVRSLYDGMVRIVVSPTWAKLIDFDTTLPSAVEELVRQREDRQTA
jgi:hypothetical protein